MHTHQDETLQQRYARENHDYLKLCGSMTAEQVADLKLQLNNSLAREQALQHRLTVADQRAGELEGLLRKAQQFVEAWGDDSQEWMDLSSGISNAIPCDSSAALKPAAEGEGS